MDEDAQIKRQITQLRGLRTRFETLEHVASSGMHMCEPGSRDWRVQRKMHDWAQQRRLILEELLAEIDREQRKDAFRIVEEEEEEQ